MPTLRDQLKLSLAVYEGSDAVTAGWTRIDSKSEDSGFDGAAYRKGNQIVIAFRGWDDLDPRDITNIARAYDGNPFEQIKDAQALVDDVLAANPNAQISLAGHSLGGGLASIMAVRNNLKAVTFGAIESVGAAFNSMNGYDFDPFGPTLWSIPEAGHNVNITRAQLGSYSGVINYAVFGEIASYNDHTVLRANQIGQDRIIAEVVKNGIRRDDSLFGRYANSAGDAFSDIIDAKVKGAPYSEAFSTAIHALGFHALALTFTAQLPALWQSLPRLAFQLTNDRLATGADGGGDYQATYDFLDAVMLDHLNHGINARTTAKALINDFQQVAGAGANSTALANADVNTAVLQLAIQYAATQVLGDDPAHKTNGVVGAANDTLVVALAGGGWWGGGIGAEGARLIRQYTDFLLGDAANLAGGRIDALRGLIVEANNGQDVNVNATNARPDLILGGRGDDGLVATAGNDITFGFAGNDSVYGGAGHDILAGGFGKDLLASSAGRDILIGGAGSDQLAGGGDNDLFVFTHLTNGFAGDRIFGFEHNRDTMVFDNDIFTALGNDEGALPASAFHIGNAAGDGNDRIIYNANNGALFYDADGTGGDAAIRVATLTPRLPIDASDFSII